MLCFPNAKINIGLNVIEKRTDGYHNLETVFYPIGLCDVLEIIESKKSDTTFHLSGLPVDGDNENNLCLKAYRLLKKDFDLPNVEIALYKIIPMGAGLGGGSSDAAFTLKTLNDLFKLNITNSNLEQYAAKLGSDCAFFINNKPAFATGRGELLTDIELNLSNYYIALINPAIHVSTAIAFAGLVPQKPTSSINIRINNPIEKWKDNIDNDFERFVFAKYPKIEEIKNSLYASGAIYAAMSGSGSTVYGLFEKEITSDNLIKGYFTHIEMFK